MLFTVLLLSVAYIFLGHLVLASFIVHVCAVLYLHVHSMFLNLTCLSPFLIYVLIYKLFPVFSFAIAILSLLLVVGI